MGGRRGVWKRKHRREGLGTCIEREKIGGRKKVWGADFSVGKGAVAWNQAIGEENVQVCFQIFAISLFSFNLS